MAKVKKYAKWAAFIIAGTYLVLLVPEQQAPVQPPGPAATAKQPFAWNEDAFWNRWKRGMGNCGQHPARNEGRPLRHPSHG
jgi:hypothetical protein